MSDHPLVAELAEVDRTLLTAVTTVPPDSLRPDERTLTRAFLLLAHAVLEERVEEIFLSHFREARGRIQEGSSVPVGVLPLYAAVLEWGSSALPSYPKRNWLGFVNSPPADEHVASVIRKNHGLKEDNVRELAKLVGIEWAVIDDGAGIELAALTTLGVKRGAAGHTSPFSSRDSGLSGEEYPANVREWVSQAAQTVIRLETLVEGLLGNRVSDPPGGFGDRVDARSLHWQSLRTRATPSLRRSRRLQARVAGRRNDPGQV